MSIKNLLNRLIAASLASTILLSSSAFAIEEVISSVDGNSVITSQVETSALTSGISTFNVKNAVTGNLTLTLGLTNALGIKSGAENPLDSQNLTVSLLKDGTQVTSFNIKTTDLNLTKTSDGYSYFIKALNPYGETLTTESYVNGFSIKFSDVSTGSYKVVLSADGYTTYTSETADLTKYSQNIIINDNDGRFMPGDANGDGKVDNADLNLAKSALDTKSTTGDVNGDGVVDILDIALINRNKDIPSGVHSQEIFSTVLLQGVASVELSNDVTVNGDINDIFSGNTEVKLQQSEISQSKPLEIQIPFDNSTNVEISEININTPHNVNIEDGTAIVEYIDENGATQTTNVPLSTMAPLGVHAITENEGQNTVTINLGKRVVVKKVTISVTKVTDTDGNANYVSVTSIEFVKDIVPENIVTEVIKVSGVKATAGSAQVTLNWNRLSGALGYRVYAGESKDNLTAVLETQNQFATVGKINPSGHGEADLENYKDYYFAVTAINGTWESSRSDVVKSQPKPNQKPLNPDNVKVTAGDGFLNVSWGKTDDAESYNVYYKLTTDTTYTKSNTTPITSLSYSIPSLTNGLIYDVYVTAVNPLGESGRSLVSQGTPYKELIEDPGIPKLNKISSDNIKSIEFSDYNNYSKPSYPNGFTSKKAEYVNGVKNDSSFWWLVDGDFGTHWTAHNYGSPKDITFTFNDAKEMNYVVFTPRLDGSYKNAYSTYSITVWEEGDDLSSAGKVIVSGKSIKMVNSSEEGNLGKYAILEFPKSNVVKMKVFIRQADGAANVIISASEVNFYEYDSLGDDIANLFSDSTYTSLKAGVTADTVNAVKARLDAASEYLDNINGYYINPTEMKGEVALATSLLSGNVPDSHLVIDGVHSTKGLQPLGVASITALSNVRDEIYIYADIPGGETITIVPTQYFAEASAWRGTPVTLTSGKNILDIQAIHSISGMKGGSLYYEYSGTKGDQIKLHIANYDTTRAQKSRVLAKIPVLDLLNWDTMSEANRRAEIKRYIEELTTYNTTINVNGTDVLNSTEISMPYALLSIPAGTVLSGINAAAGSNATIDAKVDVLYNNTLAWQEFMTLMLTINGVDTDDMKNVTRENIRYMRMFGKAFMYAAGSHIGVGYGSTGSLVQGKPVSVTGSGNQNGYFGWGIAHEVGHNKDTIGYTEVTNNIYALYAQVADGAKNTQTSRVPFDSVFEKTAKGSLGFSNNVFVSLGMYWQLRLAYEGDSTAQADNFMYQFNKLMKASEYASYSKDVRVALIASKVANKNLTEFFTRWGILLPNDAKTIMSSYPAETRSIWYLSDESRTLRLAGATDIAASDISIANPKVELVETPDEYGNISFTAKSTWTVTGATDSIQGFEVYKDGKATGFVRTPDENGVYTFNDLIGAANNLSYEYTVAPVTKLGSVFTKTNIGQVRVAYDVVIDRNTWTSEVSGNDVIVTMDESTPIVGIRIKNAPQAGTFDIKNADGTTIKTVNFASGEVSASGDFVAYFTKPGAAATDTRFWTYDVTTLTLAGLSVSIDNVDFVEYPGDTVDINAAQIGRLTQDYVYGDGEDDMIPAGTLVITGSYRGDPVYNYIKLKGRFAEDSGDADAIKYIDRDIDGYTLMFAEIPEDGEVSDISDGIWFFVPNVQKEAELQDHAAHEMSILPESIKAEIYRSDIPNQAEPARLMGASSWVSSPEDSTMPNIEILSDFN